MDSKKITAGELLKKLEGDADFIARRQASQEIVAKQNERLVVDQAPLLDELNEAGIKVSNIWELIQNRADRVSSVPILLKHLKIPYLDRNREGIARALAIPEVAGAWPNLKSEYEKAATESGFKIGLADALSAASSDAVLSELIEMIAERANGNSRLLLLDGLKRSKTSLARETLAELSLDPDFAAEIKSWR